MIWWLRLSVERTTALLSQITISLITIQYIPYFQWIRIFLHYRNSTSHYSEVIVIVVAFQIRGVSIACSTVCSGADERKHQSSASLAFVRGFHWWATNSPHKSSVMRKMLMTSSWIHHINLCSVFQSRDVLIIWISTKSGDNFKT